MAERGLNGIYVSAHGRCTLRVRFIGGPTRLIADGLTLTEAKAYRERIIADSPTPASAIGVCKIGNQWRAQIRFQKTTYNLGDFPTEEEAAAHRLKFDAWAEHQTEQDTQQALRANNDRKNQL